MVEEEDPDEETEEAVVEGETKIEIGTDEEEPAEIRREAESSKATPKE